MLTSFQIKKFACQMFEKAMSIKIPTTKILLLDWCISKNGKIDYVYFMIGNVAYAFYACMNGDVLCVYPNRQKRNGMQINL